MQNGGVGVFRPSRAVASQGNDTWSRVSPVDDNAPVDMDAGVKEWLWESSQNPALPMEGEKPVVAGSCFESPRRLAETREWVQTRLERRNDLGFRVLYADLGDE